MLHQTKLEQLAYGHAAAKFLSELGDRSGWYAAYCLLAESVDKNEEPELTAWAPFENDPWSDILDHIDAEAEALLGTIKLAFNLAHKGIVESAIDCTLDSDMNALCLQSMVEKGHSLESSEAV